MDVKYVFMLKEEQLEVFFHFCLLQISFIHSTRLTFQKCRLNISHKTRRLCFISRIKRIVVIFIEPHIERINDNNNITPASIHIIFLYERLNRMKILFNLNRKWHFFFLNFFRNMLHIIRKLYRFNHKYEEIQKCIYCISIAKLDSNEFRVKN